MSQAIPAFPLLWPAGWRRLAAPQREPGRFSKKVQRVQGNGYSYSQSAELTIAEAVERVRAELQRMRIRDDDLVISSNLQLRLDGFPRSGQAEPADPAVAVYWQEGKERRCMAVDRYRRVADNLAAIAATLDAMRAIERHGGAEILNRAFTGFAQLEAPLDVRTWWQVLQVPEAALRGVVESSYRSLRSLHHPDKGGTVNDFRAVQAAYDHFLTLERPV